MDARVRMAVRVGALLAVLMLLMAGCGGGAEAGGTIQTTEKDFSIALDRSTVTAGDITFDITNKGPSTHEFVVFKTDLAAGDLPLDTSTGQVDEEADGVEHVDEKEDIEAGASGTLVVTLEAGSYVLICNLPGHYQQGMHAALTVS